MIIKIAVIGARGVPATYGGIEKHCEELYSRLVKIGCSVTLYARSFYTDKNIKEYKGINLINFDVMNIKGFETLYHSLISTIHATFSDVDIIHYHAQGPAIWSWIPKLFAPGKVIGFTCHGIDWKRSKWGLIARNVIKLGELASVRFTDFKIGVSHSLAEYYERKFGINLHNVTNGVIDIPFSPLNKLKEKYGLEKDNYFLFVGRIVPEKTIETAIKAFRTINTDKKFVIVGDSANTPDYVSYLKALARNDRRIIFTSYLFGKELEGIYSNAFAYISSSSLEGLPITVLEAMSCAKPIILSNIPAHREILSHDREAGLLFRTKDIHDCKRKSEYLLSLNPEEISFMSEKAKNVIVKHFNWENISIKTFNIYNKSIIDSQKILTLANNQDQS